MMSRNRQAARDRVEAHSDFLINQKAEEEIRVLMEHLEAQNRALATVHEALKRPGGASAGPVAQAPPFPPAGANAIMQPSSPHQGDLVIRNGMLVSAMVVGLAVTACGGSKKQDAAGAPSSAPGEPSMAAGPSVDITSPMNGDTVQGPQVHVHMDAHGFMVVPAGNSTPNSGHYHLFLDRDLSPMGQVIPKEPGHIVHLGDGSSDYVFDSVPAEPHRLIVMVGDSIHIPVQPPIVDTVSFTVR
jgi:Domain of unknown function (DUF4399)/Protein of unknown function (DUF1003)